MDVPVYKTYFEYNNAGLLTRLDNNREVTYGNGTTRITDLSEFTYTHRTDGNISAMTYWNTVNMIYGNNIIEEDKTAQEDSFFENPVHNPQPDFAAILQSGNLYLYCCGNPINYIDPWGMEQIVISGGLDGTENFKYNFIETAIKQIKDWQSVNEHINSNEEITWIVANWKYSEQDIGNFRGVANSLNVNFIVINDKNELFSYINTKNGSRADDLISNISFFAHGTAFDTSAFPNDGHEGDYAIALGLYKDNKSNNNLNFFNSDLSEIESSAFAENNYTYFGTCRTAAEFYGEIFAQNWVNVTHGKAHAATTRTSYNNIYPDDRDTLNKVLNRISGNKWGKRASREKAREKYGFSEQGCINYPEVVESGYMRWFEPK